MDHSCMALNFLVIPPFSYQSFVDQLVVSLNWSFHSIGRFTQLVVSLNWSFHSIVLKLKKTLKTQLAGLIS
jgi:hypothetical protein